MKYPNENEKSGSLTLQKSRASPNQQQQKSKLERSTFGTGENPPETKTVFTPSPYQTRYMVFDLETTTLIPPDRDLTKMELAVACIYDSKNNQYAIIEDPERVYKMLNRAEIIVGFNHLKFDLTILKNHVGEQNWANLLNEKQHIDILDEFHAHTDRRYRVSLENMSLATLNEKTYGGGKECPQRWANGDKEYVYRHNKEDVRITHNLFKYGIQNNHIKYTDSYTPEQTKKMQVNWAKYIKNKSPK